MEYFESNIKFTFNANEWELVKFDDKTNLDYHKVANNIANTKAVDFVGIFNSQSLFFFEIKNFRSHTHDAQTQVRLANGAEDLTSEIAQKVRDTLACIVGASRNSTHNPQFWNKTLDLISNNHEFRIIAWIEEDTEIKPYRQKFLKNAMTTRTSKLKSKLNWLTSRVFFESIHQRGIQISGLSVELQ